MHVPPENGDKRTWNGRRSTSDARIHALSTAVNQQTEPREAHRALSQVFSREVRRKWHEREPQRGPPVSPPPVRGAAGSRPPQGRQFGPLAGGPPVSPPRQQGGGGRRSAPAPAGGAGSAPASAGGPPVRPPRQQGGPPVRPRQRGGAAGSPRPAQGGPEVLGARWCSVLSVRVALRHVRGKTPQVVT
ncbi:hypothetical protein Taro_031746 [Colocasia esculenta]|uniref:Uncharacterized protein n=1 Tax=Colocasia esculenta TaxID=4460 RepID=A0A843W7C1_COLES|nr:hypothetical protein [Colocasia esculenta]